MTNEGARMSEGSRSSGFFRVSVMFLLLAALHYRVSYTPVDADLWGHVRFGQDIKKTGRIVTADSYSYLTAGQRWVNHEWLAEYVFALALDSMGTPGLVLLKTVVDLIIIVGLYVILARQGFEPLRAGIVIVVVAFVLFYHILTVRPHLFTYLLFLATSLILKGAETGRDRRLFLMPPLFALWVNLHGGFLAGLGVLFAWSLIHLSCHFLHRPFPSGPSAGRVLAVLIGSAVALLLNPYGLELLELLLRTATVPRPEIMEWRSVTETKWFFVAYLTLVFASLFSLHFSGREKRPALILIYLLAAVLPLMAIRHLPLFAIATVVFTGEYLADVWNRWPADRTHGVRSLERGMSALSVAGGILLLAFSASNYTCIPIVPRLTEPFPARAVALLEKTSLTGNLACHFNWGEYIIWHLGPRIKVSMDGRRETVYSEAVYAENSRFQQGVGDWDAILRRPETDMVLVPNGAPPFNLLVLRSDWTRAYQDSLCSVFVRGGSRLKERFEGIDVGDIPVDGDGLCFP
jgi:hypothetical protein